MGFVVAGQAMCTCPFGVAPSNLMITPQNKVMTSMPLATIMDNKPMMNILPFGMCSSMANPQVAAATSAALGVLTPMPCIPMIPAPWAPGSPTVLIANFPALTMNCKLNCAYGGVISIVNPGQTTIQAP